jgi:hypothetical protein
MRTNGKWKTIDEQYKIVSENDDTIASFAYGKHDTSISNLKLASLSPDLLEELEKLVKVFEPFAKEAQYVSGLFMTKELIKKAKNNV